MSADEVATRNRIVRSAGGDVAGLTRGQLVHLLNRARQVAQFEREVFAAEDAIASRERHVTHLMAAVTNVDLTEVRETARAPLTLLLDGPSAVEARMAGG